LQGFPYVGGMATGGLVAATVGERGRELALMPNGSRVVSSGDTERALEQVSSSPTLIIEQLIVDTENGTATVVTGDETFEAQVKRVTKRQGARAGRPSPGGRSR
jgi:hypothetical protein